MSSCLKQSTLGARISSADFRDFRSSESRYAPHASRGMHAHDFTYVSLVLRGSFEERVGRRAELARSASVVVMPHDVTHEEAFGPLGARSVTVALKPSFFSQIARTER